jgi:hypothetical protein
MSSRWLAFYGLVVVIVVALVVSYMVVLPFMTQGPNDRAAESHATRIVQAKYGLNATIDVTNFQYADGRYSFQYDYKGQKGKVFCRYNPATHTFTEDIVSPPGS